MLEIDCQFTKDSKVVIVHDANLFRLTGINMNVSCACYDELPNIKIAIPVDFEPGTQAIDISCIRASSSLKTLIT